MAIYLVTPYIYKLYNALPIENFRFSYWRIFTNKLRQFQGSRPVQVEHESRTHTYHNTSLKINELTLL